MIASLFCLYSLFLLINAIPKLSVFYSFSNFGLFVTTIYNILKTFTSFQWHLFVFWWLRYFHFRRGQGLLSFGICGLTILSVLCIFVFIAIYIYAVTFNKLCWNIIMCFVYCWHGHCRLILLKKKQLCIIKIDFENKLKVFKAAEGNCVVIFQ